MVESVWHVVMVEPVWHVVMVEPVWHVFMVEPVWHVVMVEPVWHVVMVKPVWHVVNVYSLWRMINESVARTGWTHERMRIIVVVLLWAMNREGRHIGSGFRGVPHLHAAPRFLIMPGEARHIGSGFRGVPMLHPDWSTSRLGRPCKLSPVANLGDCFGNVPYTPTLFISRLDQFCLPRILCGCCMSEPLYWQ